MITILLALCLNTGYCEPAMTDSLQTLKAETAAEHHHHPQAVYRGMGSDVEQWRPLVAAWFPADQVDRALAVMACESGGNPNAKNPTSSARGLFQILASLWAPHFGVSYTDLYNPETNVRLAARIWQSQGWRAWTVYPRCGG